MLRIPFIKCQGITTLHRNFDVLLSIFISVINQLDAQYFCFIISLFHAFTCFEHMCSSSGWYQRLCNRCDDTRVCVMQFWPPDDEHMCSKHVEAWNKLIIKHKYCASIKLVNYWDNYTESTFTCNFISEHGTLSSVGGLVIMQAGPLQDKLFVSRPGVKYVVQLSNNRPSALRIRWRWGRWGRNTKYLEALVRNSERGRWARHGNFEEK